MPPGSSMCTCTFSYESLIAPVGSLRGAAQGLDKDNDGALCRCNHILRDHEEEEASSGSSAAGWLRDLTREGVESNPRPVFCRGKKFDDSACNCTLKRDDVVVDEYYKEYRVCECGHNRTEHDNIEVSFSSSSGVASLTVASVSQSIGRVLTWMATNTRKKAKTEVTGSSDSTTVSSASSSSTSSEEEGMWVVSGQAVCVVSPRIMLTATHVCFDGSTRHRIRVLYTPLNGSAPQSFAASLIRYSGLMDVSVLLLETNASPFLPVEIVPQNSPLFDKRGESVALACFPLVTDLNANVQSSGEEKVVVHKSSVLVKMPRILPGSISGTTPQTTDHKGISRNFQLADCTYPSFAGCSGGGVFSLQLSSDGVKPQLLGVHTAAIYQTGQSQLRIASLVEAEFDGLDPLSTKDKSEEQSSTRKRKAEASSEAACAAAAAVNDAALATPAATVTTPEDTPTKKFQLKLADEVAHKSALAVCVVADTIITQHPAWNVVALLAEAAVTAAPVSAPSADDIDIDVGIAHAKEESREQQSSPRFVSHNLDTQCLYD